MSSAYRKRRKKKNNSKYDNVIPLYYFNNNCQCRCILVEGNDFSDISSQLKKISDEVNRIVQKLSLEVKGRQIPFISLDAIKHTEKLNEMANVRVFLKGLDNEYWVHSEMEVHRKNISHLIEMQIAAEYRQITFSNIYCDAKLVLDDRYLYLASVDLFLDLLVFHSFSFLRDMSIEDRKRFSFLKYQFYKDNDLECYYDHDEEDELLYYSLAFSAHKQNGELDLNKYLMLWNQFMQTYYSDYVHIEDSCEEQLEKHRKKNQIRTSVILSELSLKPAGDYLLLLTNRKAKNRRKKAQIEAIFGKRAEHLGAWKIVPMEAYSKYESLINQYYISAFKIVKA